MGWILLQILIKKNQFNKIKLLLHKFINILVSNYVMAKHSKNYKTLEHIGNYSLSNLRFIYSKLPSIIQSKYRCSNKNVLRNCALFSCAYLTGGRISEILELKYSNITKEGDWLIVRLPNLKNKKTTFKDCLINLNVEKPFLRYLLKYYIMQKAKNIDLDCYLFTTNSKTNKRMNRTTAYRIFIKVFKSNPHFFRKLRASHLLEYFKFDAKMLQQYMGWANIISSEPYLKISKQGMMKRYLESSEEIKKILGVEDK